MLEKTLKKTIHNANELANAWPPEMVSRFQAGLLAWYYAERRVLPWREVPSLYKTVVSEFMLQQTRVHTVLPYFEKWMELYPDFKALAAAEDLSVLKAWEGLGYYSRARNLHKLARKFVALKEIPRTRTEWLEFPGVGPYISAAITSISFGQPAAVIDGNVVRVLARILEHDRIFNGPAEAAKAFGPVAEIFLNMHHPGDHNQAVMELGATVCLPRKPRCPICPVRRFCKGNRGGSPESLPQIERRKTRRVVVERAFVLQGGSVLLYRNPADSPRLAGLHELPFLPDVFPDGGGHLFAVKRRSISDQVVEEKIYRVEGRSPRLSRDHHWVHLEDVGDVPMSGPHRAWLQEFIQEKQIGGLT